MKTQVFSFPIDDDVIALVLDDDTMTAKSIIMSVAKNGSTVNANGYSDGTNNIADNTDLYCAYVRENNIEKIKGKVQVGGFSTVGEVWFDFPTHDVTYTATGIVIGE